MADLTEINGEDFTEENSAKQDSTPRTFVLSKRVTFGYHPVASSHMTISHCATEAVKIDPEGTYAFGVTFGARKLKGLAEFEVILTEIGTGWSGTFKLGVMRVPKGAKLEHVKIPRYSPDAPDFCVWCNQKIQNRLTLTKCEEKQYGYVSLDNLKCGDRLGLQLTSEGDLGFFVNGMYQGRAAEQIYLEGFDVYAVVDHYGRCKATRISRSGMYQLVHSTV